MNIYGSPRRKQSTLRGIGPFKTSSTKKSSSYLHKSNT